MCLAGQPRDRHSVVWHRWLRPNLLALCVSTVNALSVHSVSSSADQQLRINLSTLSNQQLRNFDRFQISKSLRGHATLAPDRTRPGASVRRTVHQGLRCLRHSLGEVRRHPFWQQWHELGALLHAHLAVDCQSTH